MNEYRSNPRGSLSHHGGHHPIDAGKSMDKLFDKVILGVLVLMLIIGALVYLV